MHRTFRPEAVWRDLSGDPIDAHGAGLLRDHGTWFWFGSRRTGYNCTNQVVCVNGGINLYSSADLYNWRHESTVVPALRGPGQLSGEQRGNGVWPGSAPWSSHAMSLERPKVVRCPGTGKYVMWVRGVSEDDMAPGGTSALAAVFIAEDPRGPWRAEVKDGKIFDTVGEYQFGDATVFAAAGGSCYLYWRARLHNPPGLRGARLRADCIAADLTTVTLLLRQDNREAPAVFQHAGWFYLWTTCTNGWSACPPSLYRARTPLGDFEAGRLPEPIPEPGQPGNRCPQQPEMHGFGSQSTYIVPNPAWRADNSTLPRFIYWADHWETSSFLFGSYVVLPLFIMAGHPSNVQVRWRDEWALDEAPRPAAVLTTQSVRRASNSPPASSKSIGYCGTHRHQDIPVKRSHHCSPEYHTSVDHVVTLQDCALRCLACKSCRHASFSLQTEDCSLYRLCNTNALAKGNGYLTVSLDIGTNRSELVPIIARGALGLPYVARMVNLDLLLLPTVFPAQGSPPATHAIDLVEAVGQCDLSQESTKPVDNDFGCRSNYPVQHAGSAAPRAPTLQDCVLRCLACAQCALVSFSPQEKQCQLFRACDRTKLAQGRGHRTVSLTRVNQAVREAVLRATTLDARGEAPDYRSREGRLSYFYSGHVPAKVSTPWRIERPLLSTPRLRNLSKDYDPESRSCSPTRFVDCWLSRLNTIVPLQFQHAAEAQLACWSLFRRHPTLTPRIILGNGVHLSSQRWTIGLQKLMAYEIVSQTESKASCSVNGTPRQRPTERWFQGGELLWLADQADAAELHRRAKLQPPIRTAAWAVNLGVINRHMGTYRRLLNADAWLGQIARVMHARHYSLSYMDSFDRMSFLEQAQWVHQQDILVSPHGAQNINFLFARPCTAILEIYPKGYYLPGEYLQLARAVGAVVFSAYDGEHPYAETAASTGSFGARIHVRNSFFMLNTSVAGIAVQQLLGAWQSCRHGTLEV